MASGLQTLHDIDRAISKARSSVNEVSMLPSRVSEALASVQRKRTAAYGQIASDRLALIEEGGGGSLGYVDRQAEKLLAAHAEEERLIAIRISESLKEIETLEAGRRRAEKKVLNAVTAYDKAAALAEVKILDDPDYMTALDGVETLEGTLIRAEEKLVLAKEDEAEKGTPYLKDKFFTYLRGRQYGTRQAKGWGLTKLLDHWVAKKCHYRQNAENYRRLTAIPARLATHVERLEEKVLASQDALQALEQDMLSRQGVTTLREASLGAQNSLDAIDADITIAEEAHQALRAEQTQITGGDSGPYREAVSLLSATLKRKDLPNLRRIASQTRTRDDDRAIEGLRDLERTEDSLRDDQAEAKQLVKKYQRTLKDLENVRRRFKKRRYDAPSSVFGQGDLMGALLGQVLTGVLSGDDFWRQLQRAQKTIRRYSDEDFGGVDWTEGLRLPRSSGRNRSGSWGGSTRRRTSIPRMPRQSLPRIKLPRGGGGGGFRTGGGF